MSRSPHRITPLALALALSPLIALSPLTAHAKESEAGSKATQKAFPAEAQGDLPTRDMSAGPFKLSLDGYIQTRYQNIRDDERVAQFIGRNDGFSMSNARLNLRLKRDRLRAFFSLEGGRERREPLNRAQGDVRTTILDAYMDYEFSRYLTVRFGRFKPAYDANEWESTAGLLFADRALESRGVLGVEGWNVAGLSLTRQTGLQVLSDIPLGKKVSLQAIGSVTNGNSSDQFTNDNESLAYTGRVFLKASLHKEVRVRLGGGVYLNDVTSGELPDLVSERRKGFTADARIKVYGLTVQGQWMRQVTSAIDVGVEPERTGEGFHVEAGFNFGAFEERLRGVMPVYRFAQYDPTASVSATSTDSGLRAALAVDALTHHTIGLNWLLDNKRLDLPLKIQLNYTFANEEKARQVKNDRVDVLVQMMF